MSHALAHASDDRLADLALRLLEPSESSRTLDHLRRCAECETRFRAICRDSELALVRRQRGRRAGIGRTAAWALAGAAATLVVLAGIALTDFGRDDPLDYWLPVEEEGVLFRSQGAAEDARFAEAIGAYQRHDARLVIDLLSKPPIPAGPQHEPFKLILASALVNEGRAGEALSILKDLDVDTLPPPARDRARWILLTAHLQEGDRGAAEGIARELSARPGEFSERARPLLKGASEPTPRAPRGARSG